MKFNILILFFLMICAGLQAQQPETAGGKAKPIKAREVKKAEKAAEVKAAEDVRDEIYDEVDEMPVYKIGNKAFYSLMRQNFEALEREGVYVDKTMTLNFVVGKDGTVRDMVVLDNKGEKVTESKTLRQNMPYWGPGRKQEKAVSTRMHVPIEFILEKN
ncbi:MAG TPA: hypothetical protein PLQ53_13350 [Saprospiraceae bacterium]|jgi:hypothetical protein|nr:hypothetical protein [Candidatus Parvibacillus calidus]WKZ63024.1 MAG: hypothetical protein QY315_14815 [Saprospiraceae bacterium]HRN35173.1 hypothetical protein [Saprospiraceae bacterium]